MESTLDHVAANRESVAAAARDIVAKAEAEARGLTAEELESIKAAAAEAREFDATIDNLRALAPRPVPGAERAAVVKREERTYMPHTAASGERSFFVDAFKAFQGDFDARGRIERHMQEARVEGEGGAEFRATTTSSFAGLVVPQYLVDLAALVLRNGRPAANLCQRLPLPDQGTTFQIPRGTTGAAVAAQATENTSVQNTDEVWTNLTITVATQAGQQDVSRQSIERGTPGLDQLLYLDLAGAYHAVVDTQVINGSGASGQMLGILQTGSINAATAFGAAPTATNFTSKLAGQIQAIAGAGAQVQPGVIIMHPRRWGWLSTLMDTTGRPVVQPAANGVFNALGFNSNPGAMGSDGDQTSTRVANVVGYLQGLPVVTDPNVPTNVGSNVEDIVVIADMRQALLWEEGDGQPRFLRFEQTLGNQLTIKFVLYGYTAFSAGRYPSAFGKIGGLDTVATQGLVAPTF